MRVTLWITTAIHLDTPIRMRGTNPLTDPEAIQAGLPTDKPSNRRVEEFYDNSILEELSREGFIKTISNK
jgi:hypothetical protein